ncbi:MAG: YoaK family protein [Solirubrobacteraceae bacterium]
MLRIRPSRLVGSSLLSLAFAGGALDATSYLGLGKVFTANMTGNTVLLVAGLVGGADTHPLRSVAALCGFSVGVFIGALVVPPGSGAWPARARPGLALELLALIALLIAWAGCGVGPIRYELIGTGAVVMGMQSVIARSSGVRGVNTTYITGTLTTAVARLAQRVRPASEPAEGAGLPSSAWISYGGGAVAGALAERAWHSGAVSLPIVVVAAVCLWAWRQREHEEQSR